MPPKPNDRTLMQRMSDALAYIIAFPFIAMFIAMKRMFTDRQEPAKSYRANLPEQKYI